MRKGWSLALMIYVLKALYSFLLPPGIFIVLFAALTVWSLRFGRRAALASALATLVLYAASTPLAGEAAVRTLEQRYSPRLRSKAMCM
ncbi:hypothetical protein LJK88_39800 [Paenibacillus sp. P26]|nr:hypothetical protein LJK88_39800 [Paenibacillus sp. P26]UUZ92984.1 hypothetical protein LJK87_48480 [Paenibacillus sp. P25]